MSDRKYIVKCADSETFSDWIADMENGKLKGAKNHKNAKVFNSEEEVEKFFKNSSVCMLQLYDSVSLMFKDVVWVRPAQKLSKEEFDGLLNETVSKKDYDVLLKKVSTRFYYIVDTIMKNSGAALDWFDFDNGFDGSNGVFDSSDYKEKIRYTGQFLRTDGKGRKYLQQSDIPFGEEFPTTWLKDDFEWEIKEAIQKLNECKVTEEKKKQKELLQRKEREKAIKEKMAEMEGVIFSKLNDEEKKFVEMLSFEKVFAIFEKERIIQEKRVARKNKKL